MIESNILGAAVGIQNQGVIDKTEGTNLPSTGDAVIAGKFKRGRMDKAFVVTRDNYRALLGHDPSNPSYLAVEDAFKRGISEISILRIGGMSGAVIGGGGGDGDSGGGDLVCSPSLVLLDTINQLGNPKNFSVGAHLRYRINNGTWADFEFSGSVDWYSAFSNWMDGHIGLITIYGEVAAPFFLKLKWVDADNREYATIQGAHSSNDLSDRFYTNDVGYIERVEPTALEFITSEGLGADLVQELFGGSTTLHSCSVVSWNYNVESTNPPTPP